MGPDCTCEGSFRGGGEGERTARVLLLPRFSKAFIDEDLSSPGSIFTLARSKPKLSSFLSKCLTSGLYVRTLDGSSEDEEEVEEGLNEEDAGVSTDEDENRQKGNQLTILAAKHKRSLNLNTFFTCRAVSVPARYGQP